MTTRQYHNPPKHSGMESMSESQSDYLTPDSHFIEKRNLPPRPGPRIQTMPSEETIGIYSYLDNDTTDDEYFRQTLEAIESGEFSKVPEEIINWYNSLALDSEDSPQTEPKKRYYCSNNFELKNPGHEYIDIDKDKLSSSPTDRRGESPDSIKRPKRFQKGERIDFLKARLSQFLNNNFKGIKLPSSRREDSKRSETGSTSDWSEEEKCRGMVCSNSFDNSTTSSNYIENPMRRLSTEVFISQMPPTFPPPRRDTFRSYLDSDEENPIRNLVRTYSKSLENVLVSSQNDLEPPKPPRRGKYGDYDAYLIPAHLPIPSPPPRVSSRHKETLWDMNLTQEYIEPRALLRKQSPPLYPNIPKTSHAKVSVSDHESGELYLVPKDIPPTPMPRFTNKSSICPIPVLSPATHYSDPLDFCVPHTDNRKIDTKPQILPKPFHPQLPNKPVPAPKPKRLPIKKHVPPKFINQHSPQLQPFPREFRNSK